MLSFEIHDLWHLWVGRMTYVVLVSSSQFSLLFLSFIYKSTLLIKFLFPWTSNEILKGVWVISHKFKSLLQKLCKPWRGFTLPFLCPCIRRRVSGLPPGLLERVNQDHMKEIPWQSISKIHNTYSWFLLCPQIQHPVPRPNPVDSSFKTCLESVWALHLHTTMLAQTTPFSHLAQRNRLLQVSLLPCLPSL